MAMQYHPQQYYAYEQPRWSDDVKPGLIDDDASSLLNDKAFEASEPTNMMPTEPSASRRSSVVKSEDNHPASSHAWHENSHGVMLSTRHYSQSSVPMAASNSHFYGPISNANCAPGFMPTQPWSLPPRSEASTPTPFFGPGPEPFEQQYHYSGGPVTFNFNPQDPTSAVSMSPQSSQGGWASNTSSDAPEPARNLRQRYRGSSPMFVMRSDGIRKKNAKFDIPAERNINTIDTLIAHASNDEEKKELKQQKRLLRNRQAALDSRMRKKQNAEKLEADKKVLTNQKTDLEDTIAHLENLLRQERQQWIHERQKYMQHVQQLSYDRDEAIRTKTLETTELRRMNNILKDTVRDLECQQSAQTFPNHDSDVFSSDFNDLRNLGIDDDWDDNFNLLTTGDHKMDDPDTLQRQATPRPAPVAKHSSASVTPTRPDVKVDAAFSFETVTMCLLLGAFWMSQAGSLSTTTNVTPSVAVVGSSVPALSDEYRAEAGSVLQAVLASSSENIHEAILPKSVARIDNNNFAHALSGAAQIAPQRSESLLDNLQASLMTPSRQQQVAAAFSLSATSYNHINSPDCDFDNDDEIVEVKPTKLQQLFANMQAERDGLEKMAGLGSKARERSVLLDRVPEKVLRDFRDMIAARRE